MASSPNAGWHAVSTSRLAHFFGDQSTSICGQWGNAWIVGAERLPARCPSCMDALRAVAREGSLFP